MPAIGAMSAEKDEIEIVIERCTDRVRRIDQKKRVAIRLCPHDRFGANVAAGARAILDDELLTEPFRQMLTDQARDDVGWATSGESRRQCAPAVTGKFAPSRCAKRRAARQHPPPHTEIDDGGVSWRFPHLS
jgi:hypothetical protein